MRTAWPFHRGGLLPYPAYVKKETLGMSVELHLASTLIELTRAVRELSEAVKDIHIPAHRYNMRPK